MSDLGKGCTAHTVRLPGKAAGWAAKVYVNRRHVATVADPADNSAEAAMWAARMWMIMYREDLV